VQGIIELELVKYYNGTKERFKESIFIKIMWLLLLIAPIVFKLAIFKFITQA